VSTYDPAVLGRTYPHRVAGHRHVLRRPAQLRPTGDRVLVRPDPAAERWPSGLWMPQTAADDTRAQTGTVLAVGPKTRDVTTGDRVLFRRWGGTEVQAGGEGLLILPTRDVFAVLG